MGQLNFFLRREQFHLPDLSQVKLHGGVAVVGPGFDGRHQYRCGTQCNGGNFVQVGRGCRQEACGNRCVCRRGLWLRRLSLKPGGALPGSVPGDGYNPCAGLSGPLYGRPRWALGLQSGRLGRHTSGPHYQLPQGVQGKIPSRGTRRRIWFFADCGTLGRFARPAGGGDGSRQHRSSTFRI